MNGKIGCVGYNKGEILFVALFSPLFWILYFPVDSVSGKVEVSERYIKTLNCGHTLQNYDTVFYKETTALERQMWLQRLFLSVS